MQPNIESDILAGTDVNASSDDADEFTLPGIRQFVPFHGQGGRKGPFVPASPGFLNTEALTVVILPTPKLMLPESASWFGVDHETPPRQ